MTPRRRYNEPDFDPPPFGMTQWAQVLLKMTSATAVIVIAGFLVWKLASGFDEKMDAMSTQHAEMAMQYRVNDNMTRRMLVVLRVMCVNAARDEIARQNCLQETVTVP